MDTMRFQDRQEIQDCLLRYVRGVDRKNWEQVRSAYHADAYDDHGNYKGGIDGFIDSVRNRHATIEQSMHVVGNMLIEFAGPDSALMEAYFICYQRLSPEAGDARLAYLGGAPIGSDQAVETEIVGRYVDRMTRKDGAWRTAPWCSRYRAANPPQPAAACPTIGHYPDATATILSRRRAGSLACRRNNPVRLPVGANNCPSNAGFPRCSDRRSGAPRNLPACRIPV